MFDLSAEAVGWVVTLAVAVGLVGFIGVTTARWRRR
jgi:hypothetical protein